MEGIDVVPLLFVTEGVYIATSEIVGVFSMRISGPRKLVKEFHAHGPVIDVTKGRAAKSIILTKDKTLLISAVTPRVLLNRIYPYDLVTKVTRISGKRKRTGGLVSNKTSDEFYEEVKLEET